MPELPEVEVTRMSFADRIAGAAILAVRIGKPLRWPLGCDTAQLVGQTVHGVRRRGKYLLLDLDHGVLLIHLGMSGRLVFGLNLPEAGVRSRICVTSNPQWRHYQWRLPQDRGAAKIGLGSIID